MVAVRGREAVRAYLTRIPVEIATKVLPGAARAGATVIADEAKAKLGDRRAEVEGGAKALIADAVKVNVKRKDGRVVARVHMKGPGSYVANWLEYGTAPHFIRVDDEQRGGRSAGRINRLDKAAAEEGRNGPGGSLVIGGTFVGGTVYHPGAAAIDNGHGFLRSSLDLKGDEAVAAAQAYINQKATKAGLASLPVAPDDDGG
jgi:hypothetical protein